MWWRWSLPPHFEIWAMKSLCNHLNQTTKTPSPVSEPTPDPIRDPLFSQSRLPSDVGIRPFGGIRSWRAQVVPTDRPLLGRFDRDTFQSCRQSSRPHESGRERTSASLFRVGAREWMSDNPRLSQPPPVPHPRNSAQGCYSKTSESPPGLAVIEPGLSGHRNADSGQQPAPVPHCDQDSPGLRNFLGIGFAHPGRSPAAWRLEKPLAKPAPSPPLPFTNNNEAPNPVGDASVVSVASALPLL